MGRCYNNNILYIFHRILNIHLGEMSSIKFLLLLVFSLGISLSTFSANIQSQSDGNWGNTSVWNGGVVPTIGDVATVDDIVTIPSGTTVEVDALYIASSGKLIVNGILIIHGNFDMANNYPELITGSDAKVIIYGSATFSNKVKIDLSSYFVVFGDFQRNGSDNQGSIETSDAHVYVMGEVDSDWEDFTGCDGDYDGTTTGGDSGDPDICDAGNFEDLVANVDPDELPPGVFDDLVESSTLDANTLSTSSNELCSGSSIDITITESGATTITWYKDGDVVSGEVGLTYTTNTIGTYYAVYEFGGNWYQTNEQVITVDISPPSAVTVGPYTEVVSANGVCKGYTPGLINIATYTDNCTTPSSNWDVMTQDPASGAELDVGIYQIKITAVDNAGNSDDFFFDFEVRDDADPTATCSGTPVWVSPDSGECYHTVTVSSESNLDPSWYSDNCTNVTLSNNLTGTGSLVGQQLFENDEINWTVTDDAGNSSQCTVTVDVGFGSNTISFTDCPATDITASSLDGNPVSVTWTEPTASITGNGCIASVVNTYSSGDNFPIGTTSVSYTATDGEGNTAVCQFDVVVSDDFVLSYCTPIVQFSSGSISNVSFNTINNSTGQDVISDYTGSISTDVELNSTHDLSVSIATSGGYTRHIFAWFDWNKDGDFVDSGEEYDLGQTTINQTLSQGVNVPSGAELGETRMRVIVRYNSDPGPCDLDNFYGEVEDYSVNVVPAPSIVSFSTSSQSSVGETGTMDITVELSETSLQDIEVPFSVDVLSSATGGGTDYSITSSPVTISAGASSAIITISIQSDVLYEGDETVIVNMGTPTNGVQGTITQHIATITEDDSPPPIPDPTYLSGYCTYKPITITSSENLTNYQIELTVSYDSQMNADFSDIRFSLENGTVLDYWIQSYTASTSATVWVEVPTVSSGNNYIYLFYGNISASTQSDLDATMNSGLLLEYYTYPGGVSPAESSWVLQSRCSDTGSPINYYWGSGSVSICGQSYSDFVVLRWIGFLKKSGTGTNFNFRVGSDDGNRVNLDGGSIELNKWVDQGHTEDYFSYSFTKDIIDFQLDWYENGGGASAELAWDPNGGSSYSTIPEGNYYHATYATNTPSSITGAEVNNEITLDFVGSPASSVCAGSSSTYTLTDTYDSYSWTVSGGSITSGGGSGNNSVTVTWGSGSSGSVSVDVISGSCSESIAHAVSIIPEPTYTAPSDETICVGETVTMTVGFDEVSMKFDGTNDRIDISSSNQINNMTVHNRTIALWFKANDVSSRQVIYEEGGGSHGISIFIDGGSVYVNAWESQVSYGAVSASVSGGTWYHVAFVMDSGDSNGDYIKGYLNGSYMGSATDSRASASGGGLPSHGGDVNIGVNQGTTRFPISPTGSSYNYFGGYVDEFKLWNRSLEQTEIQSVLYGGGSSTNLILDYDFNNESGSYGNIVGAIFDTDTPFTPSISWSPGGMTTTSVDVSPTATTLYTYTITEPINGCQAQGTVTVNVGNIDFAGSSSTNEICPGQNDGSVDLVVSGGIEPYTFFWSTPDGGGLVVADEDQTGLSPGLYDVLITDDNGCTETTGFTITAGVDDTDPVISGCPSDISIDPPDANPVVVNWTAPTASDNCAVASFTSSHDPGDSFPLGITTVTYTATDGAGLVDNCSFDVVVNPVIIGGTPPSQICQYSMAMAEATVSGGSGNYSYLWEVVTSGASTLFVPGSTTNDFIWLSGYFLSPASYDYKLTVTDNDLGYVKVRNYSVTILPNVSPNWVTNPNSACVGQSGVVYSAESLVGSSYAWTVTGGAIASGDGTSGITVDWGLTAGSGNVSVVATTGTCTQTLNQSVSINALSSITLSSNPSICLGATSASLGYSATTGSPNEYSIDFDASANLAGFIDVTDATLPSSPILITIPGSVSAGTYNGNLTVQNSFIGCTSAVYPISVVVNPNLPVSVAIAASANSTCPGTSVTYTATPTNGGSTPSYQWKVNGANVGTNNPVYSYTPTNGDVVSCILTSNETCVTGNPATSNNINVVVEDIEIPTVASCPSDINVNIDAGTCGAIVSYAAPTFNDNCDGAGLAGTLTSGLASGSTFPVGTTTVTYQFTDAAGNGPVTCSFDVTVTGNEAPRLDCPGATVSLTTDPGTCSTTYDWETALNIDECNGYTLGWTRDDGVVLEAEKFNFTVGTTVVDVTVTDNVNSLQTTCQITVFVDENPGEAPTITAPGDVTVSCSDAVPAQLALSYFETNSLVDDNCGYENSSFSVNDVTVNNPDGSQTITRTYSISDYAGNPGNDVQIITVLNDLEVNATITITPGCSGELLQITATTAGFTSPAYQWEEDTGSGFVNISGENSLIIEISSHSVGDKYRLLVSEGSCTANSSEITLTYNDLIKPVFDASLDLNTSVCIPDGQSSTTVTGIGLTNVTQVSDNCTSFENLIITYVISGATTVNSPGTGQNDASDETFNLGTSTVVYTVKDESNNEETYSFDVVVNNEPALGSISTDGDSGTDGSGYKPYQGTEHTYSVTDEAGFSFTWRVEDSVSTDITSSLSISGQGNADFDITWGLNSMPGNYTVFVIKQNQSTSCETETSINITVLNNFDPKVQDFGDACHEVTGSTTMDFVVFLEAGTRVAPQWSFDWELYLDGGGTPIQTGSETVVGLDEETVSVTVNVGDGSEKNYRFVILNAQDSLGNLDNDTSSSSNQDLVKIFTQPTIGF